MLPLFLRKEQNVMYDLRISRMYPKSLNCCSLMNGKQIESRR